jgi:hypothetical protein
VPGLPPASRRICAVVDIERFSGRGNVNQLAMERNLREIARRAVGHARLYWSDVKVENRGDGLLLRLPPAVDEPRVIPDLITGHVLAVRLANMRAPGSQRIRLRMALTQGISHPGPTGSVGEAVIAACRLVDCAELRAALAQRPARELGVIVADDLYRDVIAHGYPGLDPAAFTMTKICIPEKGFEEQAWTYVPEPAAGALRRGPRDTRAVRAGASAAGIAGASAFAGALIETSLNDQADPPGLTAEPYDVASHHADDPGPEHDGHFDDHHIC